MQQEPKSYSPIASIFRATQTVETLIRVHNVTGQDFPVSGSAWLRRQQQIKETGTFLPSGKVMTFGNKK